ncbi:single-stranded DNA-binding protein [Synechococcus sp. KORDI-100]|uniref:single-stranded DNA-binding protein n=1 Tax=Synechococcus sp. KORDI-100 TaxID=1280380 RepID=UPI0004E067B9|nr:single-stranded DNA-binding protein [Synechococcus sp. KORDI-100]AII42752.1 single-stranded DNA-binding protein [Synechococcus sp. KORDI-100]
MNHCVLEVEVSEAPTIRYTQDNQTPIAEMTVRFDGLRQDDAPGELKVVGWGNLAQDLQNRVQVGQKLMLEGRLRMNTVPRQDGTKEKRAEFTLSRLHPIGAGPQSTGSQSTGSKPAGSQGPPAKAAPAAQAQPETASWNAAPLVPDTDEIPF